MLRHIVLFKFYENVSNEEIAQVVNAFDCLPEKIPVIKAFECGINNSPENLNNGFTHCFLMTFDSEKERDEYLPHFEHKAFSNLVKSFVDKVLVVDYTISC